MSIKRTGWQDYELIIKTTTINKSLFSILFSFILCSCTIENTAHSIKSNNASLDEKISFYITKLKDKSFISTYDDGYILYTVVEELGEIGMPAVPNLIKKLDTKNVYEKSLVLCALQLTTKNPNISNQTNGEYIKIDTWNTNAIYNQ